MITLADVKDILGIIIGFITGAGLLVFTGFFPETRAYLIPVALIFIATPIGIDIGVNKIPHNKVDVESKQLDNQTKAVQNKVFVSSMLQDMVVQANDEQINTVEEHTEAVVKEKFPDAIQVSDEVLSEQDELIERAKDFL